MGREGEVVARAAARRFERAHPGIARRGPAAAVDAPRTRSCSPRSPAMRCPTSASSATPGSRSSPRSARSSRCDARRRAVAGDAPRATISPASGTPTSSAARALRRAVVRRHAPALLSHATCSRAAGIRRAAARLGRMARGDARPSRRARGAGQLRASLLPLNEFEPLFALGAAARRSAAARRRHARRLSKPGVPPRARLLRRASSARPGAADDQHPDLERLGRIRAAATSRSTSPGPWNIGEFQRRLPADDAGRLGDRAAARARRARACRSPAARAS